MSRTTKCETQKKEKQAAFSRLHFSLQHSIVAYEQIQIDFIIHVQHTYSSCKHPLGNNKK